MNTKRIFKQFISATQVVVIFAITLALTIPVAAQTVSSIDPGMGDLQRYDGEGFSPTLGQASASDQYVGMGDLQLFTGEGLVQVDGHVLIGSSNVGMGDLQIFESEGVILPVDQLAN